MLLYIHTAIATIVAPTPCPIKAPTLKFLHSFLNANSIATATMLATTLGLEFDPDKAWDKRKQEYKMSGQIVHTQSVAQTAEGDKNGLFTTVLAAAVFMEDGGE